MTGNQHIAALLLRCAGVLFVAASLVCSPWLAGAFDPSPPIGPLTAAAMSASRTTLFWIGLAGLGCGELVGRGPVSRFLSPLFNRPLTTRLLASFLLAGVPVTIAEVGLRPFTIAHVPPKATTLFVRDPDLGWRMRPGVTAPWRGAQVTVNRRGLRGPEIPYSRDPSRPRLLYLGDSVTVGYGLSRHDEAYPFRIEALLEKELGHDVETVNAAVNGYSSWQEHLFLEREGLKYRPDIVIVGFVLNDVTEPLGLVRFGGSGIGDQLENSYFSIDDWLQHTSALYWTTRRLNAMLRFGPDVQKGAVARELVSVEALARSPDAPRIREAWSLTLASLESLVGACTSQGVACAIVVFPFTFQFLDPDGLAAPQREMMSFCDARGIPCLDLLPVLSDYLRSRHDAPQTLFLDADHLSVRGSEIVAEFVVNWLRSEPTLWSRIG